MIAGRIGRTRTIQAMERSCFLLLLPRLLPLLFVFEFVSSARWAAAQLPRTSDLLAMGPSSLGSLSWVDSLWPTLSHFELKRPGLRHESQTRRTYPREFLPVYDPSPGPTMTKTAPTDHPVHALIANRWSPCGFSDRTVSDEDLRSLFEAARWAASSYNEQPWSYIVATKDKREDFERALSCLVEANQAWAQRAPVIAISVARLSFVRNDKPNTAALHDLGLASATLSLEATSRGLYVHQMIGILPDRARDVYAIPADHQALTALAIGFPAEPESLPDPLKQRDLAPRLRKPLQEFVYGGQWGSVSPIVGG